MEKETAGTGGYKLPSRIAVVLTGVAVSVVLVPAGIVKLSLAIDAAVGMNRFFIDLVNIFLSVPAMACGLILMAWSLVYLLGIGGGTPMPLMPPQKLVVTGPYRFVRNPMALGVMLYYTGLSLWIGSYSAVALSVMVVSIILFYNRFFEEPELEGRFGADYRSYRESVPSIIPLRGVRAAVESVDSK